MATEEPPNTARSEELEDPIPTLEWTTPKVVAGPSQYGVIGEIPSKRSGHTLTISGTNGFMFGGCDDSEPIGPTNDMFLLKMSGTEMEWARVETPDDGQGPAPRWRHSATMVDDLNLMIFGGFHSGTNRFNDVWYFNVVAMEWTQPTPPQSEFTPRGNHLPSRAMQPGVPSPRGAHSATLIDKKVWVFGGYGGLGYSRRDFDDVYTWDTEEMSWDKVKTKGTAPEKRSAHTACAVVTEHLKQLFVFGGWNSMTQFSDMHILDTRTLQWSSVPGEGLCLDGEPRWNMSACAVVAIPHWKFFVFGGTSGKLTEEDSQGQYRNDITVYDTGHGRWVKPEVVGDVPSPRADTEIAYDARGSRIVMFGGWANEWYGECATLNVGTVVGPPYAIMHIDPKFGPVTGGTEMLIEGIDFTKCDSVLIRFNGKKGAIEVKGEFVSPTKLTCKTPDFRRLGPGEVEVRVSLKGDSFTTTYQKFDFFAVSDGAKCLAFGPGVLEGQAAGETTMLVIQARDMQNNPRTTGGDVFKVTIKPTSGAERHIEPLVEDQEDGTYVVSYTAPEAGAYSVDISFEGTFGGEAGRIRGAPFNPTFSEGVGRDNNMMAGRLVNDGVRADLKEVKHFTKSTNTGLDQPMDGDGWSEERKLNALIAVKEHLLQVEVRQDEVNYAIDRLHATLEFLKKQGASLSQLHHQLEATVLQWAEVLKKIPLIIAKIAPLVKAQAARTKAQVAEYAAAVEEYRKAVLDMGFWKWETGSQVAFRLLDEADEAHLSEMKKCDSMAHLAQMFECTEKMEAPNAAMGGIAKLLTRARALWECADEVVEYIDMAMQLPWEDLDGEGLEEKSKELMLTVKKLHSDVKNSSAFKGLQKMTVDLVVTCPLLNALKHEAMKKRHWTQLLKNVMKKTPEQAAQLMPMENEDLLMKDIYELGLHQFKVAIEDISDMAQKELKQEAVLKGLDIFWTGCNFMMTPYKDTEEHPPLIPLLRLAEEDFDQLDADQLAVNGICASRYQHFKKRAEVWQAALSNVSEVMLLLNDIQRAWSYLEPLFIGSDEVKKELPDTAERFESVDEKVRAILIAAWATKNAKTACNKKGLLDSLTSITENMELCKKSLTEFLDGKRKIFPRFYFVSEADLLDILSNGSAPERIMHHVDKVFLATKTLELDGDSNNGKRPVAVKFIAGVGSEDVDFEPHVPLEDKPEVYLQLLLDAMTSTLQVNLKRSVERYPTQARSAWVMNKADGRPTDPAQIMLLVNILMVTRDIEEAFEMVETGDDGALKARLDSVIVELTHLVKITRTEITKAERQRVMCSITMDTHTRDLVAKLHREEVHSKDAFQWQAQLKQKWSGDVDDDVEACICDAVLAYGWEYLGNGARLVITPLTDRIYVTATQALNLKMGCAPAGPAGTGKTESTKDLACAVGKACYVFNCSPEMDYMSLGSIFKGLSSSGSWGCFDEFNRLVPEVLSVCSVQFKSVCDGCKAYDTDENVRIVIEGDEVSLNPTCGAFITMNPGYLGRSELPEGLKALFRPMTVMVPDLILICENMLMAEGFNEAKTLASKFFSLYSLLSQLLSKQEHYDWGLRAIKSVLVVAGGFKRQSPELPEGEVLMRALRDFNTPKIVKQDEVVFFGLLGDLFPGLEPPRVIDQKLEECVQKACEELYKWPDNAFRLKIVQLEELLAIRHCVFLMGPPGAGKTQAYKVLARARVLQFDARKTTVVDLNPKAISTEELYGCIALATREWKDGVLSKVMRDLGHIEDEKPKWIILDGDLDANWIESMNSVMDDNRMLTLASNERVPLKTHMRMLFEIRDLTYATPATVSRAGILYISTADGSQWNSLVCSWVAARPDHWTADQKDTLSQLFQYYFPKSLRFIERELDIVVPINDITLVQTMLYMFEGVLHHAKPDISDQNLLETYFVFSTIWGFGSGLTVADDGTDFRKKFSDWWRKEWKVGKFQAVKVGSRGLVFDFFYDPNTSTFEEWKNSPQFEKVTYDPMMGKPMNEICIPTPETCSISFWMELLISAKRPVMLAGMAGTGKTQLVKGVTGKLCAMPDVELKVTTVNFNYFTSATTLQSIIEGTLVKKFGTTFGPAGNGTNCYFVDDLNLPEVDPYNTQSAIALLRQQFDYGHWYDLTKLTTKTIQGTQYIACLNPTAGCFFINPRLQRHFATFALGLPGPASLVTIYEAFLSGHLGPFDAEVSMQASNIIKGALALHKTVSETFRKTAANFHYEFNIRHLSNVFQGLLTARPDEFPGSNGGVGPAKFVKLWLHESERVYGDRLVSLENLNDFRAIAAAQSKKLFPTVDVARHFSAEHPEPLVFCHFAESVDEQKYDQVLSMENLKKILERCLLDYNETNPVMDLVLFADAMQHVCRIVRIVKNGQGHALLVGVGGSGKQSLSKLAAFICNFTVEQIVIHQTYGVADLKNDLQHMYARAGLKDEGVMFLFTDGQITNERFLVYLNDLLASGMIPDLYSPDEIDTVINAVLPKCKAAGYPVDRESCLDYFYSLIRKNLHVVLCFSPVGDDFRTRAKCFPALVSCTVIDWFQPWPEDALFSVGKKFLDKVSATFLGEDAEGNVITQEILHGSVREGVERFMPFAFASVNDAAKRYHDAEHRFVYSTPKSYLEVLKLYAKLIADRLESVSGGINRLSGGLQKMADTEEMLVTLEEDIRVKLALAEESKASAEEMQEEVERERAVVEEEGRKADIEHEKCDAIAADVSVKAADAQADLAKAEPAVIAAMAALDTLNKKDLGNCKTMSKPPSGVDDVFAAVMVLLAAVNPNIPVAKNGKVKDKDRSWDSSKKFLLGNVNAFLDDLKTYKAKVDNAEVPTVNWREVRPYLELEHFNLETIEKKNSAAAGLCSWVINIVMYYDIVVEVEPKRQALKEANEMLEAANTGLKIVQDKVDLLKATFDQLNAQFEQAKATVREAEETSQNAKNKLELARRLTAALSSENERWTELVGTYQEDRLKIAGDCLISAAFISYIGPFTKQYRQELIETQWIPYLMKANAGESIPMSEDSDPVSQLVGEATMAAWHTQGLPSDSVSGENAAIAMNSSRWPLLIDPQLQGINWVRNMIGKQERVDNHGKKHKMKLDIIRLPVTPVIEQKLEAALENGTVVLVENMGERIDAVLMPIISRATFKKGTKIFVRMGDKEMEWSSGFKLFLHTKLSNPHYPPEIQAETTLVNFMITPLGLEEQLLSLVIRKERPDLASQKAALVQQQNHFKIQMIEMEADILEKLDSAEGDVTDDVALVENLEKAKKVSDDVKSKVEVAKQTEITINLVSEKYRSVAARGALLFFLMNDLYKIHSYYVYSLNAFVVIFQRGIDVAGGGSAPAANPLAGGKKSGLLSKFKKAAQKVIDVERFHWNKDVLQNARMPSESDHKSLGGLASKAKAPAEELDDEQVMQRCTKLENSITGVLFNYLRRGLFGKDKLIVATQLTFLVQQRNRQLSKDALQQVLLMVPAPSPGGMGPALAEWLPAALWPKIKSLETVVVAVVGGAKPFETLGDDMISDSDAWREWFNLEYPERKVLPGAYGEISLSSVSVLLILRAMRPDRLTSALQVFVNDYMGKEFTADGEPPFDMQKTYQESSCSTPILFVLFPGVDPTPWVESLGKKFDITSERGTFLNISMGQGQEALAEGVLERFSESGAWIFLQNVHLMQAWLPKLERKLELCSEHADAGFRCFISAEAPPLPYMKFIPESLLQSCIKVANEAPTDLKSNLRRAWAGFDMQYISACSKPKEFLSTLFALCFFHGIVLGRRRFGAQGWSRPYSFNVGDLKICANVLRNYIDNNETVPWADLRYIFGEIMYGGHITDFWDRRTNNTYLSVSPRGSACAFPSLHNLLTTTLPPPACATPAYAIGSLPPGNFRWHGARPWLCVATARRWPAVIAVLGTEQLPDIHRRAGTTIALGTTLPHDLPLTQHLCAGLFSRFLSRSCRLKTHSCLVCTPTPRLAS